MNAIQWEKPEDVFVLGLTGQRRHGKDSVADRLVSRWGYTKIELPAPLTEELCIIDPWCELNYQTALTMEKDFARFSELVKLFGIDAAKDMSPDVRSYQQRYGTDVIRKRVDVDRWVKLGMESIRELSKAGVKRFVIPNIRADNERAMCDVLVGVERPGYVNADGNTHEIEEGILKLIFDADYLVVNGDSLNVLHGRVDNLVTLIDPRAQA